MGTMTFLLPARLSAESARELERASVAGGPENMPGPTEARADAGRLTLRRLADDDVQSGYVIAPWEVAGAGRLMGASSTLMERPRPYHLQTELARGKVNQLRGQAADWCAGGLVVPPDLEHDVREAALAFGRAATQPPSEQAGQQAQAALELSYAASDRLAALYVEQMFQARHQRQPRLDSALGCRLGAGVPPGPAAGELARACNTVSVPLAWNQTEPLEGEFRWDGPDELLDWADERGLPATAGPLIDFSPHRLPDWLWLWERDLPTLASFMCKYVESAVRRYGGRVRRWQLTAAANCARVLNLRENELLWLTVRLAESAWQADSNLELVVGVAQPWGEYLAEENRFHSPFSFAETLIRAGLNLAALDLEIVMGVRPRGSYCRDALETLRLLDLYTLLGVPLRVTLGYPSDSGADALGDPEVKVAAGNWRGGFGPEVQAAWAATFAALALCKPHVQGVQWCHFADAEPHQFPHCGLADDTGKPKPALEKLRRLREEHLR